MTPAAIRFWACIELELKEFLAYFCYNRHVTVAASTAQEAEYPCTHVSKIHKL